MTITKSEHSFVFEKGAGSYELKATLAGCTDIIETISVNQDSTIARTMYAGDCTFTFDMPENGIEAHRADQDSVKLVSLTAISEPVIGSEYWHSVNGEWKKEDYAEGMTGPFFSEGSVVAQSSGYTGSKLSAPSYTITGESCTDYADLTATKYFMLKTNYKYLTDMNDLVTVTTAAFTNSAGITAIATEATQDYFIVTVVITGPSSPSVTFV